jgi:group II intron reverse transcriptase/maturase
LGNLATPGSIQKLQAALHAKAKAEPGYRFYQLYDKVYRADVLEHAYASSRANQGVAGVDGERFEDIEAYGVDRWLGELAETLRKKSYQPQDLKRVYIRKANGKLRPLSIPTIRDRTVMTAALLVLSPISEADLSDAQHGYRPERSGLTAVKEVHGLLSKGHTEVVDADFADYFGSIPHAEVLQSVARRVVDRQMLHLLKMWLIAPVEEDNGRGGKTRTTVAKDSGRGTPQGSPISVLFSNLYMRRLILGWSALGHARRFGGVIVNYADDLVICCRSQGAAALTALRQVAGKLKLTINEDKTHVCRLPEERFDFLGYSFERCYTAKGGKAYLGTRPSRARIRRMTEAINVQTDRKLAWLEADEVVRSLNRKLAGWANYFCLGPVSKSYRILDAHAAQRLRRWLCEKHGVRNRGTTRFPDQYLYETLGLIKLRPTTHNLPWAKT